MRLAFKDRMRTQTRTRRSDRGSTLLEALIGLALIAVLLVTMAWLVAWARATTAASRRQASAMMLARSRLEELAGLEFAREPLALGGVVEITDLVTDLSGPEPNVGGRGLADSPADSLVESRAGYVDRLDSQGRWADPGGVAAVWIRRWRIERVGAGASELALFDVVVAPATLVARLDALGEQEVVLTDPDVVRLSGMRARRAR